MKIGFPKACRSMSKYSWYVPNALSHKVIIGQPIIGTAETGSLRNNIIPCPEHLGCMSSNACLNCLTKLHQFKMISTLNCKWTKQGIITQ